TKSTRPVRPLGRGDGLDLACRINRLRGSELENALFQVCSHCIGVDRGGQIEPAKELSLAEFAKVNLSFTFLVLVLCFGANNKGARYCGDAEILSIEAGNRHPHAKLPVLFNQLRFGGQDDLALRLQPIVKGAVAGVTASLKYLKGALPDLLGGGHHLLEER